MLVLSRKIDEKIVIGGKIIISVVRINGDKCRIGIEAPSDVSIDRMEVYERKQAGPEQKDTSAA